MSRTLPEGWWEPTPGTREQYALGRRFGFVSTGHVALRSVAEAVPLDEITGAQARGTIERVEAATHGLRAAGRPAVGIAAPQLGISERIVIVPRDEKLNDFITVVNPSIEVDDTAPLQIIPHGCLSANETSARLGSASALTLRGFSPKAEPLELAYAGISAAVVQHEVMHLDGIRAADTLVERGRQLDYRPPEKEEEYRAFIHPYIKDPSLPEWLHEYPAAQWLAARMGEFSLDHYIE